MQSKTKIVKPTAVFAGLAMALFLLSVVTPAKALTTCTKFWDNGSWTWGNESDWGTGEAYYDIDRNPARLYCRSQADDGDGWAKTEARGWFSTSTSSKSGGVYVPAGYTFEFQIFVDDANVKMEWANGQTATMELMAYVYRGTTFIDDFLLYSLSNAEVNTEWNNRDFPSSGSYHVHTGTTGFFYVQLVVECEVDNNNHDVDNRVKSSLDVMDVECTGWYDP